LKNENKKILIVDDETDLTLAFKLLLKLEGFEVDTFNDPVLALSKFTSNYYDVALLDIKMPKMDGFSLYREITKRDNKVKVYFLTASEEYYETFRKEAFAKIDKDLFIQKPIDNQELKTNQSDFRSKINGLHIVIYNNNKFFFTNQYFERYFNSIDCRYWVLELRSVMLSQDLY
jgi:CheY-like chemotaxis protein